MRNSCIRMLVFGLMSKALAQSGATSMAAPASSVTSMGPTATAGANLSTSSIQATSASSAAGSSSSATSQCSSQIAAVPSCAVSPLTSAAASLGCGTTDYACWCQNSDALQAAAQSQISSACGNQASKVLTATEAICKCVQGAASSSSKASCGGTTKASSASASSVGTVGTVGSTGGGIGSANGSSSAPYPATSSSVSASPTMANSSSSSVIIPPGATGAASACAVQATGLPSCAIQYFQSAAQSFGCGSTDYLCWCSNGNNVLNSANQGIVSSCQFGGPGAVLAFQSLCDCAYLNAASGTGGLRRSVDEHLEIFHNSLDARAGNEEDDDECSASSSSSPTGSAAMSTTMATSASSTSSAGAAGASSSASASSSSAIKSVTFCLEGLLTAALSFFLAI